MIMQSEYLNTLTDVSLCMVKSPHKDKWGYIGIQFPQSFLTKKKSKPALVFECAEHLHRFTERSLLYTMFERVPPA